VAGDPNVPNGEVPTVEHAMPLLMLGTVIVPVTPEATGLTSGETPGGGKPFGPTDALGTVPSEEVTPSGGVAVSGLPTWANAGLQHNKGKAVAAIEKDLMGISPINAEGLRSERPQAPQSVRAAEAMTFFFITADR